MKRSFSFVALVLAAVLAAHSRARAADTPASVDPARIMPPETVALLAIEQPEQLLDTAIHFDRKLWERVRETEGVRAYFASKKYSQLLQGVSMFESAMDASWDDAVRALIGGGLYVGVVPQGPGFVVVVRGRDPKAYQKVQDAVSALVAAQAIGRGKLADIQQSQYDGVDVWQYERQVAAARFDGLLVISNRSELVHGAIDRRNDAKLKSLADDAEFRSSRAEAKGAAVWGCVDLDMVRSLPKVRESLERKANNPLLDIALGGVRDALISAPRVTAALRVGGDGASLAVSLPRSDKAEGKRAWCLPDIAADATVARVPHQIGSLVFVRNLGGMWSAREELFDERVNAGFVQAESNLSLFLSGRDVATEVMPGLGPTWQVLAAHRARSADGPQPALKLPELAAVIEVTDETLAPYLQLAFQDIVGATNLSGAQNGKSQLLFSSRQHRGTEIMATRRMATANDDLASAPIEYNFQPACALYGGKFVLGTSATIVSEVIDSLAGPAGGRDPACNSRLRLEGGAAVAALADNRDLLVSQTMLRQGGDRQMAVAEIDALLALLGRVKDAGIELDATDKQLKIELSVRLAK